MSHRANPSMKLVKIQQNGESQNQDGSETINPFPSVHTADIRAVSSTTDSIASIQNSIAGDTGSAIAYHAKKDVSNNKILEILEPQVGIADAILCTDYLNLIATTLKIKNSDNIIKHVEGLSALIISINDAKSMKGVLASITMYLQTFSDHSLSSTIYGAIKHLLEDSCAMQLGLEEDDDDSCGEEEDQSGWIHFLSGLKTNWRLSTSSGLFARFSQVLGLIVTAGLCNASDVTFKLGDYKLIEPDIKRLVLDSGGIVPAVCDLVMYFTEILHVCWHEKSFSPLFFSKDGNELEVEFARLQTNMDLCRNGNLTKLKINTRDFFHEMKCMKEHLEALISESKGFDRRVLEDKYRCILKNIAEYRHMKLYAGIRRAPFVLEYAGDSGVGKTTLCEQTSRYLLMYAQLDDSPLRKYVQDGSKKHWDGVKSDVIEVRLDDYANTKPAMMDHCPSETIINVCNNVPYSPPMANLQEKGKIFLEPELVSITTNVKNLDAQYYSNNCHSIQRRAHYVLEPTVKEQFANSSGGIDSDKVVEHYKQTGEDERFQDLWNITVSFAVNNQGPTKKPGSVSSYEIAYFGDIKLENVSIKVVLNFLAQQFVKHREFQASLVERNNSRNDPIEKCPHEGCEHAKDMCMKHCVETQVGFEALGLSRDMIPTLDSAREFYASHRFVPNVPAFLCNHKYTQMLYMLFNRADVINDYTKSSKQLWSLFAIVFALSTYCSPRYWSHCLLLCLTCGLVGQWLLVHYIREKYYNRLREHRLLGTIHDTIKKNWVKIAVASLSCLGALYAVSRFCKAGASLTAQGSLCPKTVEEIRERDSESSIWTSVVQRPLPISEKSKTVTQDVLSALVDKNLVYGSVHHDNGTTGMMNALFLKSNTVLVAKHYFEESGDELKCTFRKNNPEQSGGKFAARLSLSAASHVPNTDLVVCYVPSGGSFRDITGHFPLDKMSAAPFEILYRKKDGMLSRHRGMTVPQKVATNVEFEGGMYKNLTCNTFRGMCGATLVSETRGSVILGVHLGGKTGTPVGCYGILTQKQIDDAIQQIRGVDGVLISGSAGAFKGVVLDTQICTGKSLHPKSPINFMPEHSQVEYLGSCVGASSFHTSVEVTPMSEHITDVCNVPNIYCPPNDNPSWKGYQVALANIAVPALPYPHDLLVLAVRDYKEPLVALAKDPLWNDATPLTDLQNVCGIPGKKFMDGIKTDTSIGYPLSGPKKAYMVDLEPTEEYPHRRAFNDTIMNEVQRCENLYKNGQRAYPIAKACKKDEILSKPKMRIFYGNPISLTYNVRKYFLPILRILQMNPLTSECAVGINSHGPEWEEFHEFALANGEDRIFGGDYGKYDQKIPSQLILAAMRILIDMARHCNYTEEDLRVMEAISGDVAFALVAFNGDLIGLTEGSHISGNSLTVIINGICGSLNLRAFFYSVYPTVSFDARIPFRDAVHAMTYGDDNIGSVGEQYPKFNIRDCSKFLGDYGQIYTMPDKESELIPYLPRDQFEFLKRQSVYHPKLGVHIGALLDKSIYKSLHCFMRPKHHPLSEKEACAINVDGALREWFNHGESKYESQRKLMKEVAIRTKIDHMCTGLELSYDERCAEWQSHYIKTQPAQA